MELWASMVLFNRAVVKLGQSSVDAGQDNCGHIVRLGTDRRVAFLARAQQGVFNQGAGGLVTRGVAYNLFDLFIGQVIVDAIGAEQHAVADGDWRRNEVNIWPQRSAESLGDADRKSTRLNSSHVSISYA